jgi:plasmid stabilization system protein ParE
MICARPFAAKHSDAEFTTRWFDGLQQALRSLTEFPERCPYARENGAVGDMVLRQLNYHAHRIIFTVLGNRVHVLHIRHRTQKAWEEHS